VVGGERHKGSLLAEQNPKTRIGLHVSEDHRGVVGTAGPVADRQQSLAELLDREVLPCLERPGRLLGPFDLPSATVTGKTKMALVWPSIAEGAHAPAALRSLFVGLPNPRTFSLSLGTVPSPNLRVALRTRGLPLFGRPDWASLDEVDLWFVWLDHPLQITGLLTILDASGLPVRAPDRTAGPRIVAGGPAVPRVRELLPVYVDAVWPGLDSLDETAWNALAEAASMEGDWKAPLRRLGPVLESRPAPERSAVDAVDPGSLPGPSRRDLKFRPDLVVGPGFLRRSSWREHGRADAFTDHIVVGAGSEALRESSGLPSTAELLREIERSLSLETASLALHFVIGLEGESEADRLAVADFMNFVVDAAPRGARQVSLIIHELAGAAPDTGFDPVAAERVERILARVRARRLRVEAPLPCLSAIESVLGAGSASARVLEHVWSVGAHDAEAPSSADPAIWRQGLGLEDRSAEVSVDPAPAGTGLPDKLSVEAPASVSPVATRSRMPRASRPRANRWVRWQALVPRHFDYRIEYSKLGRLRFLGATELSDLLLGACERASIPICTSGVVQPRPRVSFGPSLPAGVAGDHEYIDFSLARKIDDIHGRLTSELPEEIRLIAVEFMPRCGPLMQLSRIAFADYEAALESGIHSTSAAREADEARVRQWNRRIEEGLLPEGDAPDDPLQQLHRIHWSKLPDDSARLEFTLDLRTDSARCKPREVVSRVLEGISVDPRLIPLRRRRLVVVDDSSGRARLRTPLEQARLARYRQRTLERMCAE
jgi:radical SAM-linked protein